MSIVKQHLLIPNRCSAPSIVNQFGPGGFFSYCTYLGRYTAWSSLTKASGQGKQGGQVKHGSFSIWLTWLSLRAEDSPIRGSVASDELLCTYLFNSR